MSVTGMLTVDSCCLTSKAYVGYNTIFSPGFTSPSNHQWHCVFVLSCIPPPKSFLPFLVCVIHTYKTCKRYLDHFGNAYCLQDYIFLQTLDSIWKILIRGQ